ncbi:hypothetical protein [Phenylobacterium sp.]|uniref:hypothetical protein n=1 Tax=Phenylobacterium sp. TaxID=1871053 RepID=UPI0025FFB03E|nr:hypothetical protein [Phenylobacterium sp.]
MAYYESPPAQSLLAKMPAYTAAVTPKLGALLPALEADLEAAFCEEIGCETVKRAPATTSSP